MNLIPGLVSCIKVCRRRKLPRVHSAFILSICEHSGQHLSQRWLLSGRDTGSDPKRVPQTLFSSSSPAYQCIAVSQNVFDARPAHDGAGVHVNVQTDTEDKGMNKGWTQSESCEVGSSHFCSTCFHLFPPASAVFSCPVCLLLVSSCWTNMDGKLNRNKDIRLCSRRSRMLEAATWK